MLIFKVFKVNSIIRDVKEASNDPVKFGSKLMLKKTQLSLIISLLVFVFLLSFFYIFGYTNLVINSYGIFKFLFWLLLIPSLFIIPLLFTLIKAVSNTMKSFPKEVSAKEIK
ncbi:MAG: hypothetical protein ABH951_02540 [Patescibacteria group bacterium]